MSRTRSTKQKSFRRYPAFAVVALGVLLASTGWIRPEIIGTGLPESFSFCELSEDANEVPRPECEASDFKIQADRSTATDFGFSVVAGFLNGDDFEDLVVGDPQRNRIYVYFGRQSVTAAYGLDPELLADREVPAESQADLILEADLASGLGSMGFSLAVGSTPVDVTCPPNDTAVPLLIGAPGDPGMGTGAPGSAFYVPAGALCTAPTDPPTPVVSDVQDLGQAFRAPFVENDDEFGYSVAFGRILSVPGEAGGAEDAIVGARTAASGAGKVIVFPVVDDEVGTGIEDVLEFVGQPGDGLGEALATGDLDQDFDTDDNPTGDLDDLAIGAVGSESGKVLLVQGPLSPTGGAGGDGVYREGEDPRLKVVLGERPGDFFGFSLDISANGRMAAGAVFADELPSDGGGAGRINAGKVYLWEPVLFEITQPETDASTANTALLARRSADQLGFAVAFRDLNNSGPQDLIVSARREDGAGLGVNEIDQGTVYIIFDDTSLAPLVDLGQCSLASDCTGVSGVDVMLFGADREADLGDQIGFALTAGDFNGDGSADLFISSQTNNRVYAVTLDDADEDRGLQGRNLRDDDDDNDGDPDSTDCAPLDAEINSEASELPCNGIDENCNGMDDDAPDDDEDGFAACSESGEQPDCDDADPNSFPGAPELCDGNDNACDDAIPEQELDDDMDGYVECDDWADTQGDDPLVVAGGDCSPSRTDIFPGAGENEADSAACAKDADGDGFTDVDPPEGIAAGTDCDDSSAGTFPGAAQIEDPVGCMRDRDDDGYGDAFAPTDVLDGTDCADTDPNSFPGAPELCDGNDNACAGMVPVDELDDDDDGYVVCAGFDDTQEDNPTLLGGGDCDDAANLTFPGAAANETDATACMKDADFDDYGDVAPPAGVTAGTDCDDLPETGAQTFVGAAPLDSTLACMRDDDDDDYGDETAVLPVIAGGDCADDDESVFPGGVDLPDDGLDQDCSGDETITCFVDDDLDGFGTTETTLALDGDCEDPGESTLDTDCDDTDEAVFPGAEEIIDDGTDQDCSGADTITCTVDADQDGAGTTLGTTVQADDGSCDAEQQESATADDCDDADPTSFPGAAEACDGNDNDCDGGVPDDETDGDGDNYVTCSGWEDTQGDDPLTAGGDDCDDSSAITFPGAAALESASTACMTDRDGDDYGDLVPEAGITPGTDCDDSATGADTFPGAAQIEAPFNCMKDADDDGYGDTAVVLPVAIGSDCADADPNTFPGVTESCDGNDNNCTGVVPVDETDVDSDGWVACAGWSDDQGDDPGILGGGDCDETSIDTFPGSAESEPVPEICRKDSDGDGYGDLTPPAGVPSGTDCDDDSPTATSTFPGAASIEAPFNCMRDVDDDGYGDAAAVLPIVAGGDCEDEMPAVNPGVPEGPQGDPICTDMLDNDCDGFTDGDDPVCAGTASPCPDADTDGFADCLSDPNCDIAGLTCGDCDDADNTVNPGATEICDNQDNDCNTQIDEGFDQDGDDFTSCDLPVADCDDMNAAVSPAAAEVCNDATDNDCDAGTPDIFDADSDGTTCDVDCNDADPGLNLVDGDSDGFGTCDGDCDDTDDAISPGLAEVCDDGVDNDCNAATPDLFDGDMDGAVCDVDCDDTDPAQNLDDMDNDTFSSCAGDCNDQDAAINPLADDVCDGIDTNCDGIVDEDFDLDEDGFSTCSVPVPDCNDADPDVNPGEVEACGDAKDNDCNPATPDIFDGDMDGSTCVVDCDDADPASFPGAVEACDGNDNDCNTLLPADEADVDGDMFVACSGWADTQGDDPGILGGGDCDESSVDIFPGAAPNESVPNACMEDADGDDFGDQFPPVGVIAGTDCDDDSSVTFPGAAEIDAPNNCMRDTDDDGYGDASAILPIVAGDDCDDDSPTAASTFPGAAPNEAVPDACMKDADDDDFGDSMPLPGVVPGTDCEDTLDQVNPAQTEGPLGDATCSDLLDNDCDTAVDDADLDCTTSPIIIERRRVRTVPIVDPPGRRSNPRGR